MDEYISREEAVKKIKSCIFTAQDAWESVYNTAMAEIMECIKHIPSADVQPVRFGRWVKSDIQKHVEVTYECSECGHEAVGDYEKTSFCGGCGVKMKDDKDK